MQEKDKVTIKIPRVLYRRLKAQIENTGFSSVNQFVVHCMRDIVSGGRLDKPEAKLTKNEITTLRQRLRNLGYI